MDGSLRSRLRDALREAMKARDQAAISAYRSALAAIGNAEAVDAHDAFGPGSGPIAGARSGLGAADVPRRAVTEAEVTRLVRAEVVERRAAADLYARREERERAQRLRAEAAALEGLMARAPT
jgi:uncharacterized protein YqeY